MRLHHLLAAALLLFPIPAHAAGETELLRSYVGTYAGRGVALYETGGTEAVDCSISFGPGAAGKILIQNSSCVVAGTRMSFAGAMAFLDGVYQAAITSNVGFKASTVGRREGDSIIYVLEDGELVDKSLGLSATFIMASGGVVVDMNLVSNVTGALTRVRVPLDRR